MTLPPELRERVYEYIAMTQTTRHVRAECRETVSTPEYKVTTSAITATCRLVHNEYEDWARKTTTAVEFTAVDMDFSHIIDFFHRRVDAKYLSILQMNQATIRVNMVVRSDQGCRFDMSEFHAWALFLIGIKLEVAYHSDHATWMTIFEAADPDLVEQCVVDESSPQVVRDNIDEIRNVAGAFDKAMWRAYPDFSAALQARRHQAFDRLAEEVE